MNYLDLFSGIGGFHLGLKQAGVPIEFSGFSEVNAYAKQVYTSHFTESKDVGDVRTIDPFQLPRIDLITFGFPCQDISVAGKRLGLHAKRSGLFFEAVKIIRSKKPRYFIAENVKGLFSSNEGRDFETILQTFTDIGYDCQWSLVNSAWFLPQNRERVYIVGYPRGTRPPKVFPLFDSFETNQVQTVGQDISFCIDANYSKGPSSPHCHVRQLVQVTKEKTQGYRVYDPNGLSVTLASSGGGIGANTGLYMLTERRTDKAKQIRKEMHKQGKDWSPFREKELVPREDQLSNCLTAVTSNEHLLSDGIKIRRLTPTECERLQGFPDGWTDGLSDSQRYKCLGNAVTVPVVRKIVSKLNLF